MRHAEHAAHGALQRERADGRLAGLLLPGTAGDVQLCVVLRCWQCRSTQQLLIRLARLLLSGASRQPRHGPCTEDICLLLRKLPLLLQQCLLLPRQPLLLGCQCLLLPLKPGLLCCQLLLLHLQHLLLLRQLMPLPQQCQTPG